MVRMKLPKLPLPRLAVNAAAILASLQTCLADHFDVEHSTFQLEPAGHIEHDSRHA